MSDWPQLEERLLASARGRSRRRRRYLAGAPLAAVAVVALVVVLLYRGEGVDVEVPAVPPASTAGRGPETVEEAFSVFRRPATATDKPPAGLPEIMKGAETRRIAQTPAGSVYLAHKGWTMCLLATWARTPSGGLSCGRAADYLDAIILLGTVSSEAGPGTIAFAFPDGVRQVKLTFGDGVSRTYPVQANGFARDVPDRPERLSWTAPNGTAQTLDFK
jgi:hypothetical protein